MGSLVVSAPDQLGSSRGRSAHAGPTYTSPPARGTPPEAPASTRSACARSISSGCSCFPPRGASCGVGYGCSMAVRFYGSAPLRITPAGAGSTSGGALTTQRRRRIPACAGPTDTLSTALINYTGGSPRVRGRRRRRGRRAAARGRIPAHAGSTGPASGTRCLASEDPRARGRQQREAARAARPRRIPARAGPTLPRRPSTSFRSEDPRVRGVDARISGAVFAASGGSPRARGRRGALGALVAGAGRIPACAGPTLAELRSYRPVCQFLQLFSVRRHRARDKVNHLASQLTYPPACTVSTATHSDSATISACAGPTSSSAGESPNPKEYPRRRGVDRRCSELRAL